MRNRGLIAALVFVGVIMLAGTVSAAPVVVQTDTDTLGATIVTFESSFEDLDYAVGTVISLTVNWTVDAGSAAYDSFGLRRYTPRSKGDPAVGTDPVVVASGPGWVTVEFMFSELHYDDDNLVDIGNGHFKLYLSVDEDGVTETVAGFGVNIHVEDPQ
jgi:hypothetical protein